MPPSYKRVNSDGSRNVFCSQCHSFIAIVAAEATFHSALCVICQMADEGIVPTEAQIAELRSVNRNGLTLSHGVAFPEIPVDPMKADVQDDVESKIGRQGYFFRALVTGLQAINKIAEKIIPESKQLAGTKKRRRILEQPLDK